MYVGCVALAWVSPVVVVDEVVVVVSVVVVAVVVVVVAVCIVAVVVVVVGFVVVSVVFWRVVVSTRARDIPAHDVRTKKAVQPRPCRPTTPGPSTAGRAPRETRGRPVPIAKIEPSKT